MGDITDLVVFKYYVIARCWWQLIVDRISVDLGIRWVLVFLRSNRKQEGHVRSKEEKTIHQGPLIDTKKSNPRMFD